MVILPQTGLDAARDLAERMRRAIAEHRFDQVGTVTASSGVAKLVPRENFGSLTQRVDEALYRAKERGRNQVEV